MSLCLTFSMFTLVLERAFLILNEHGRHCSNSILKLRVEAVGVDIKVGYSMFTAEGVDMDFGNLTFTWNFLAVVADEVGGCL